MEFALKKKTKVGKVDTSLEPNKLCFSRKGCRKWEEMKFEPRWAQRFCSVVRLCLGRSSTTVIAIKKKFIDLKFLKGDLRLNFIPFKTYFNSNCEWMLSDHSLSTCLKYYRHPGTKGHEYDNTVNRCHLFEWRAQARNSTQNLFSGITRWMTWLWNGVLSVPFWSQWFLRSRGNPLSKTFFPRLLPPPLSTFTACRTGVDPN